MPGSRRSGQCGHEWDLGLAHSRRCMHTYIILKARSLRALQQVDAAKMLVGALAASDRVIAISYHHMDADRP
jgi:hypothetical protein